MNQPIALDVTLATSTPEKKGETRLFLVWSFIIVVGIVAIAAWFLASELPASADDPLKYSITAKS
jgi:hypothetical protein